MGIKPNLKFLKPFGCPLTILNTSDNLNKFEGKADEGYLLGYCTNSKGFRVYNKATKKVQDCLNVEFLEDQANQKGNTPDWMYDLDSLSPSMNYIPVREENQVVPSTEEDSQFIVHEVSIPTPVPTEEPKESTDQPTTTLTDADQDTLDRMLLQDSIAKMNKGDLMKRLRNKEHLLNLLKLLMIKIPVPLNKVLQHRLKVLKVMSLMTLRCLSWKK